MPHYPLSSNKPNLIPDWQVRHDQRYIGRYGKDAYNEPCQLLGVDSNGWIFAFGDDTRTVTREIGFAYLRNNKE